MDPYRELGLSPDASEEEIKTAYRSMAKMYHPDAHPQEKDAEEKMNRINAAYAMLRDGSSDPFLQEDLFRDQEEETVRRNSVFYHPLFRRVVVICIAVSLAAAGIVSAFFSALRV